MYTAAFRNGSMTSLCLILIPRSAKNRPVVPGKKSYLNPKSNVEIQRQAHGSVYIVAKRPKGGRASPQILGCAARMRRLYLREQIEKPEAAKESVCSGTVSRIWALNYIERAR